MSPGQRAGSQALEDSCGKASSPVLTHVLSVLLTGSRTSELHLNLRTATNTIWGTLDQSQPQQRPANHGGIRADRRSPLGTLLSYYRREVGVSGHWYTQWGEQGWWLSTDNYVTTGRLQIGGQTIFLNMQSCHLFISVHLSMYLSSIYLSLVSMHSTTELPPGSLQGHSKRMCLYYSKWHFFHKKLFNGFAKS
jgi:hypothetical protein